MKVCFKCNIEKPITDFYKHKKMFDGHLGKCKDCTKIDTKKRTDVLSLDSSWVEKENRRAREKYYRLQYKEKHKQTSEKRKIENKKWEEKYPEKRKAGIMSSKIKKPFEGAEKHHWSYNQDHYKDVIFLTKKHHMKGHRFIVYDQERMMYRRYDTNELLDTKEAHEAFIKECITTKPD